MGSTSRILVVDDEEIVRTTISGYLRKMGQSVDCAEDGSEALKALDQGEYDLALVDLRMPGMDGLTLLSRFQDLRPEMASVVITGHGTMDTAVRALRLGAADFLTKPIKLVELDAVLAKVVRFRSLQRERRRLRATIGAIQSAESNQRGKRRFVGTSKASREVRSWTSRRSR